MSQYQAEIDGFLIECVTISDGLRKAIVKHEPLNRDGAFLEDMGLSARSISFRSYWLKNNYENHVAFLKSLESREISEFIHPIYGTIQGKVESANVIHDDGYDSCEIDIVFIEHLSTLSELSYVPAVVDETESAFTEGQEEQIGEAEEDLINQRLSILSQIESTIAVFEGTLVTVTNPANSIISTINYGTSLPGRLVEAVANMVERYALAYKTAVTAPAAFLSRLNSAYTQLMSSFSGSGNLDTILHKHISISCAQQYALQAAYVYDGDEEQRETQKTAEGLQTFDAEGHYHEPPAYQAVMNILEIEQTLAAVRIFIQGIIDQHREIEALKKLSAALLSHVKRVKLNIENIIEVTVTGIIPLHILCLQYGQPYALAERIMAINNFKNPNYITGPVNIYV